jgi:hypothetical protein
VIDVRPAAWDATVVENDDAVLQVLGERSRDALFSVRTVRPSDLTRWLACKCEEPATYVLMLAADTGFAIGSAALVLALRARARRAAVELVMLGGAHASTNDRHGLVRECQPSRLDVRPKTRDAGAKRSPPLSVYANARLNFSIAASRSGSSGSIAAFVCSSGSVPSKMAQLTTSSPKRERYLIPASTAPDSS